MTRSDVRTRFDSVVAIVTGSTRGIGAGIAERLAVEGAATMVTGRTAAQGEAVVESIRADGGEATFVRADLRDPDDVAALVDATVERYGGVDILVNNAGVQTYTGADEATMDDWQFVLETDFRSYWLAAKHAAEHMDVGSIVNVSSNHSKVTMPGIFPYNAVKAGINGMTRAMALDYGPNVRVNGVVSGWVSVERTTGDMSEDRRADLDSIHPVGRLGEPADIAGVVSFLASDDAAFVTGENIVVDGGRSVVIEDERLPDYRSRRTEGSW